MVGEPCEPRRERPVSLRRTGCRLALLAMLLTGVVGAFEAHAQGRAFDKLVMPGPLASAHAKYESECATCHVRFERSGQTPLCLDCHKEIARDLAAKTGFHSRSPDVAGKNVLIVDFSYKRPVLEELSAIASSIVILDHHETAERELAPFIFHESSPGLISMFDVPGMMSDLAELEGPPVVAVFDMNRSGAMMAWQFCWPDTEPPLLIRLIEDRDLWRFKHEASRPIATWLRSVPFDFERWTRIVDDLEIPYGNEIMREAEAMQRFHDEKVKEIASFARRGFLGNWYEPIVVSCPPMFASEVGNYLLSQYPDAPFAATFYDTKNRRMWSLRSTDEREPVNTIAERWGGGGHRNAAGFSVEREEEFP